MASSPGSWEAAGAAMLEAAVLGAAAAEAGGASTSRRY